MAGWHTRLWRRVKIAPGLTINLSKSGASLSVGPRGSKVTFGHGRVRQTVGLPGTGLYMTRQLPSSSTDRQPFEAVPPVASAEPPASTALAAPTAPSALYEVHYGMPIVVGIMIAICAVVFGAPLNVAVGGAVLALIAGLLYEALAAHHPTAAKLLAQLAVALVAMVTVIAGIVAVVLVGVLGASAHPSRRR